MRRGIGRRRRGPGLIGTAARTAVIAGTATSMSGRAAAHQQARAPQAAAPQAGVTDDVVAQISRLGDLLAAGLLTEEEFAAQKARILGT